MSEAIFLALWVGTALFFTIWEKKNRDNRESHEFWLSELRECLHSIENEFSRRCLDCLDCLDITQDSSYDINISNLKEEYIKEVYKNVISRKGEYFLKTLPDYIAKEHERNISEIADIYRNIYIKQRKW